MCVSSGCVVRALWPSGRVQQPQLWVLSSLSCQKWTVVLLSLSSLPQTLNACCQMRDCLRSEAAGTRGNGIIGLKLKPSLNPLLGIFIDLSLIPFVFYSCLQFTFFLLWDLCVCMCTVCVCMLSVCWCLNTNSVNINHHHCLSHSLPAATCSPSSLYFCHSTTSISLLVYFVSRLSLPMGCDTVCPALWGGRDHKDRDSTRRYVEANSSSHILN